MKRLYKWEFNDRVIGVLDLGGLIMIGEPYVWQQRSTMLIQTAQSKESIKLYFRSIDDANAAFTALETAWNEYLGGENEL